MNNLVSIITPSFNSSEYLSKTIESIMAQTYTNWELLITDDCSADETISIIKEYIEKDNRIKLFQLEENSGAGVVRNNSIKKANGRFIAFCDSDDTWLPDKLEKQISFMEEKKCALSYSSYWVQNENDEIIKEVECLEKITYSDLVKDNCVGCLTAMYDVSLLGKIYMPTLRKRQDWGLWVIIIKQCHEAFGIKEPLAVYRLRNDSISSNKIELVEHNIRVYTEVLGFSKVKAYIAFCFLFIPTYIKKKLFFTKKYKN